MTSFLPAYLLGKLSKSEKLLFAFFNHKGWSKKVYFFQPTFDGNISEKDCLIQIVSREPFLACHLPWIGLQVIILCLKVSSKSPRSLHILNGQSETLCHPIFIFKYISNRCTISSLRKTAVAPTLISPFLTSLLTSTSGTTHIHFHCNGSGHVWWWEIVIFRFLLGRS